ncbi:hypothetical protein ACH42_13580 [Endozoicomonas sp. (ex Bugula neritina AB1)]|nr:hypothetical protein ACH42_13580 [Endozoicomonas sp. (ex Bugula neritina AB1)]
MAIVPIDTPDKEITLGISSCLMGQKVRYNGGHKRSSLCMNTLDKLFHFEPLCPEVAIGLSIPREPIRLVGDLEQIRVLGTDNPEFDVTEKLEGYGRQKGKELTHISGYILMQKSPSCGMERVKVYHPNGNPHINAPGVYARTLMETNPQLPVEEEGRLHDPVLCENFFTRVYAHHRWYKTVLTAPSYKAIGEFHTTYKYQIMAHNPQSYTTLGKLVAKGSALPLSDMLDEYFRGLMVCLKKNATRKSHTNAMLHVMGYVKKSVGSAERNQLLKLIEEYRQGMIPLVAPMSMLRHFIEIHGNDYIKKQVYLEPHPDMLGLRNKI